MIASAIVGARLDYCNSLHLRTSEYNLDRLQRAQNRLAHVVLPFSAGATEAWCELHWLPIRQRITFKLLTITYKARWSGQLAYLYNSLHDYRPTRNLRSASALLLHRPPVTTVFCSRAFPVVTPIVWNSLHIHTSSAENFLRPTCKSRLKLNCSWPVMTPFQHHQITALLNDRH